MLAVLIWLNKIFQILFMVAFCHTIALDFEPHTNSNPSLGLELGLGFELELWRGLGFRQSGCATCDQAQQDAGTKRPVDFEHCYVSRVVRLVIRGSRTRAPKD